PNQASPVVSQRVTRVQESRQNDPNSNCADSSLFQGSDPFSHSLQETMRGGQALTPAKAYPLLLELVDAFRRKERSVAERVQAAKRNGLRCEQLPLQGAIDSDRSHPPTSLQSTASHALCLPWHSPS